MFMITDLTARGYVPRPDVSNIKYEPYLYRVWVVSNKANLRKFEWVSGDPDDIYERPGTHYEGRGTIPANTPILVWEEFIADSTEYITFNADRPDMTTFHKWKNSDWETDTTGDVHWTVPEELNMMFAAQDDLASGDLKILIRFYYRSTGLNINQNQQNSMLMLGMRGDGGHGYYGVDVPGGGDPDPDIPVCIRNVYDLTQSNGEVVSVTYYNLQGVQSSRPFNGINIVVTRYSNGTTSTTKILR